MDLKEPAEWNALTTDEKLAWLKEEIDDLVLLVERLYGTIKMPEYRVIDLNGSAGTKYVTLQRGNGR